MKAAQIEQRLLDYFGRRGQAPAADTDLFDMNFVDSMGVLELVTFLEGELGVELVQDDMRIDNFRTIRKIAALAESAAARGRTP
jgi:methoxymalonate biosynthesis acyl carrier protein